MKALSNIVKPIHVLWEGSQEGDSGEIAGFPDEGAAHWFMAQAARQFPERAYRIGHGLPGSWDPQARSYAWERYQRTIDPGDARLFWYVYSVSPLGGDGWTICDSREEACKLARRCQASIDEGFDHRYFRIWHNGQHVNY